MHVASKRLGISVKMSLMWDSNIRKLGKKKYQQKILRNQDFDNSVTSVYLFLILSATLTILHYLESFRRKLQRLIFTFWFRKNYNYRPHFFKKTVILESLCFFNLFHEFLRRCLQNWHKYFEIKTIEFMIIIC